MLRLLTTSDWIVVSNGFAVLLAPHVALWIGGILQRRSHRRNAKLQLFGTLLSLRHHILSVDSVGAQINSGSRAELMLCSYSHQLKSYLAHYSRAASIISSL